MPFLNGRVSYCRFRVHGNAPTSPVDVLDSLQQHAFQIAEGITAAEVESGFTTGEHVLDTDFNYEKNAFDPCVHFALRVDTNRPPADLKKAYRLMHENAARAASDTGFISKADRREAKELAEQQLQADMNSGRFRKSKAIPVLWDLESKLLYCATSAANVVEELVKRMREAFGVRLDPLSAGTRGAEIASALKIASFTWDESRPGAYSPNPKGQKDEGPVLPWLARNVDFKDFLGNEFLFWLMHRDEKDLGAVRTPDAFGGTEVHAGPYGQVELACGWDFAGSATLKREDANPARSPECRRALHVGKWPRKMGLMLGAEGTTGQVGATLTLQAERLLISAMALPEIESADTPRETYEQRVDMIRQLDQALDGLYAAFLVERLSDDWKAKQQALAEWVAARDKA